MKIYILCLTKQCWSYFFIVVSLLTSFDIFAQEAPVQDKPKILLEDPVMQMELMEAVNDLYNFHFEDSDRKFRWFKLKYPSHPMPYFLLGLNDWWRMMPDPNDESLDERFLAYMDTSIVLAERLYKQDENNIEAAFFLSAGYGFKGRLYSERKNWSKAAFAGKAALKYLEKSRNKESLSIEFLFGDGLYNYYREWVPENYKMLKPILAFFERGDKKKGLEQIKKVSTNAFYTRTEAQFFIMRIYSDENQPVMAFQTAKYLHETFPDNPYFHRYYARMAYSLGQIELTEKLSLEIMERLEKGQLGYEATGGRYATYFLGYINEHFNNHDIQKAMSYYKKAVVYSEQSKAYDSGYYHAALGALARAYAKEKNILEARKYYEVLVKRTERKSSWHTEAEKYLKDTKKAARKR
jgi:tetratricopeptide (TPR) repeat protein